MVKNPFANAGDIRDSGSVSGSRRSPGGGHGKPLQYSHLENSMDRGAWQATASWTRLKKLSMHTCICTADSLSYCTVETNTTL